MKNKETLADKRKEFNLNEKIEEVILWARMWAEYVSDEEVLDTWNKNIGLVHNYGKRKFDLTEFKKMLNSKRSKNA